MKQNHRKKKCFSNNHSNTNRSNNMIKFVANIMKNI